MKVKICITRYGQPEFRTIDVDLEGAARAEMEGTVFSCGGFEEDALETLEVDHGETAQMFIKEYL